MTAIDRQAISAALYEPFDERFERQRALTAALEAAAGPEIDALANVLAERVRNMGVISARHLLAAIGWKMIELEA